jgi:hypothetical protein
MEIYMNYSKAEVEVMKARLRNLYVLLEDAKKNQSAQRVEALENEINGLENSISGRYN